MLKHFRKFTAIILIILVLFVTVISILAIWDVIEVERIIQKSFTTLLVIFTSAAIMLFIFSVLFKTTEDKTEN